WSSGSSSNAISGSAPRAGSPFPCRHALRHPVSKTQLNSERLLQEGHLGYERRLELSGHRYRERLTGRPSAFLRDCRLDVRGATTDLRRRDADQNTVSPVKGRDPERNTSVAGTCERLHGQAAGWPLGRVRGQRTNLIQDRPSRLRQ
ncbi:MAG: hypothetical protein MUF25_24965, partial [Pirellulaceae bacterium]|nr:hypothetical protein [Pirellulaceae bacterium]